MDGKAATPDWRIAEIAEHQHGVVSIKQLRQAGVSDDAVRRRVQTGRLHRVHRGVYAVGHSGLPMEGRWMAAVFACQGGGSAITVLSHRSAAVLWGLLPFKPGAIDISVSSNSGRERRRGIRLHRSKTLRAALITRRRDIPLTNPARTIADLRRAVAASARQNAIAAQELRRAIRQAGVLGLQIEEEAVPDRTRSELEGMFLRLCRLHGLPAPKINVRVGSLEVDFLWPDQRLIVETDGYRYHRGRGAFEHDRARDLTLRKCGFEVLRLSYRQVAEEPQEVAEALRAILQMG